jgi:hypothetical protein
MTVKCIAGLRPVGCNETNRSKACGNDLGGEGEAGSGMNLCFTPGERGEGGGAGVWFAVGDEPRSTPPTGGGAVALGRAAAFATVGKKPTALRPV